jgi:hypothetical protein
MIGVLRLVLSLEDRGWVQWTLWLEPPKKRGKVRDHFLRYPALRLLPLSPSLSSPPSLLRGHWEVFLPFLQRFKLSVRGIGETVDSWRKEVGLTDYQDGPEAFRYERIVIEEEEKREGEGEGEGGGRGLGEQLAVVGTYRLLPLCGGPKNSLHKREEREGDVAPNGHPRGIYFLHDAAIDEYIFTPISRRIATRESYLPMAVLFNFRDVIVEREKKFFDCETHGIWVPLPNVTTVDPNFNAVTYVPRSHFDVPNDCLRSFVLHHIVLPKEGEENRLADISAANRIDSKSSDWKTLSLTIDRKDFSFLSFIFERIQPHPLFAEWIEAPDVCTFDERCHRCEPQPPSIIWTKRFPVDIVLFRLM